ncbi:MAG: hypothetical protein F4Z97_01560, partial [Gammaproteobacteria bacterium]|nr:hypothetical protein [Gammaproteobacteria bacterium]
DAAGNASEAATASSNYDAVTPNILITESDGSTKVSEDGSTLIDTYEIVLASPPSADVTVTVSAAEGVQVNTAGGTAASVQTLTFTAASTWNEPQTITVAGVDDNIDTPGGSRFADITHASSSADPDYDDRNIDSVRVTVNDDDPTTVTFAGTQNENGSIEFTITLSRSLVSSETVTVPLTFGGADALAFSGNEIQTVPLSINGIAITALQWVIEDAIAQTTDVVTDIAIRGVDYTLSCMPATGVTCSNLNSGDAQVVFAGNDGTMSTVATISVEIVSDADQNGLRKMVSMGMGEVDSDGLGDNPIKQIVQDSPNVQDDQVVLPLQDALEISVDNVSAVEQAGQIEFTVRLSRVADRLVTVSYETRDSTPVSAIEGVDYEKKQGDIEFSQGEREKIIFISILNDGVADEDDETFELVLTGGVIPDGKEVVAVGRILNSNYSPKSWLSRFARTVSEQVIDSVRDRIAAPRGEGVEITLAGQPFGSPADLERVTSQEGSAVSDGNGTFGLYDEFGRLDILNSNTGKGEIRTMTERELLLSSNFTVTDRKDSSGGNLAFWGRAVQSRFSGKQGTSPLDGEVNTAMMGIDFADDELLFGTMLTYSSAKGSDGEDGKIDATLNSIVPYGSMQVSDGLSLWGAAGYGSGEMTLTSDSGIKLRTGTSWAMAAFGTRSDLRHLNAEGGGPALTLTSDVLWTYAASDKAQGLAASKASVSRLRLGLEGVWNKTYDSGDRLTFRLETGLRYDGGDAEKGFGVEVGSNVTWSNPGSGLSLGLEARTLLMHQDRDLKNWGLAASAAYDPSPETSLGPSLTLRYNAGGQSAGGLDALFAPAPLEQRSESSDRAAGNWTAEAAYGFAVFDEMFTAVPYMGVGLSDAERDYAIGWRMERKSNRRSTSELSFYVEGKHKVPKGGQTEFGYSAGFQYRVRW